MRAEPWGGRWGARQVRGVSVRENVTKGLGLSVLFISHELSRGRDRATGVAVRCLGKGVELAPREPLYAKPLHPYTEALLSAVPEPDPAMHEDQQRIILRGDVPSPSNPPKGCNFCTRCPKVMDICHEIDPTYKEVEPGRFVACHLYENTNATAGQTAANEAQA